MPKGPNQLEASAVIKEGIPIPVLTPFDRTYVDCDGRLISLTEIYAGCPHTEETSVRCPHYLYGLYNDNWGGAPVLLAADQ